MGTHLRVLSKGYLMNTNMTGFRCFSKIFAKVDLALEELTYSKQSDYLVGTPL